MLGARFTADVSIAIEMGGWWGKDHIAYMLKRFMGYLYKSLAHKTEAHVNFYEKFVLENSKSLPYYIYLLYTALHKVTTIKSIIIIARLNREYNDKCISLEHSRK